MNHSLKDFIPFKLNRFDSNENKLKILSSNNGSHEEQQATPCKNKQLGYYNHVNLNSNSKSKYWPSFMELIQSSDKRHPIQNILER